MTIERLWPWNRPAVEAHYLRLSENDRRLRFFGAVSDASIEERCAHIDWFGGAVLGFYVDGELRGVAELALTGGWRPSAEIALSVEGPWQGEGRGAELLSAALSLARNRHARDVSIACLAENAKMRRLALGFDAEMSFAQGEVEGRFTAPLPNVASLAREAALEGAAFVRAGFDLFARPLFRSSGGGSERAA